MELTLNQYNVNVNIAFTVFQFCRIKHINLPCFCYHEKLSIAGNCRVV